MESLRAESICLLSILCFITHYVNYHKIQIKDDQWIHYCNNMNKVRRIKRMNIRTVLTPSTSIRADMDIHFQVEEYLQQLQYTLTTHHVKGHQTSPNLNWEAQVNNRADKLATEAQKQLTTIQKTGTTMKYPAYKAHLQVNGQIITRNYDKELQHAYTLHDFRKKMESKFKWKNQYGEQ
eukprot:6368344-Ditylum_brightwellii.AAC.1